MVTPRKVGGSGWRAAINDGKNQVTLLRDDVEELAEANRENNDVLVFLHTMSKRLDELQDALTDLHEIGIEAKFNRTHHDD